MKKYILFLLAGLAFSCTVKDEPFGAVLESSAETVTFDNRSDSKYLMINTNRALTISSSESWCTTELINGEIENLKVSVSTHDVVGNQRKAQITIISSEPDTIYINVVQNGPTPVLTVTPNKLVLENEESGFELQITANCLFKFTLPDWVHLRNGDTPAVGDKTYNFTVDAVPAGEVRTANIIVQTSGTDVQKSVTIPIKQGKEIEVTPLPEVNKSRPVVIEAETNIEGIPGIIQDWWAQSGVMWGAHQYINLYSKTATYSINVTEAGVYKFTFDIARWSGSLYLAIDGTTVGNVTPPQSAGDVPTHSVIDGVTLSLGEHSVAVKSDGNIDFDLFTIEAN